VIHRRKAPQRPIREWGDDKPTLEVTSIPVFRVKYRTLQAYLKEVFRMEINLMKVLGLTPGMAPVYTVQDVKPDAINYAQQCDNIRRGYPSKSLAMILYVLCHDGFIPPGQYILDTTRPESRLERYRELVEETGDPLHEKCKAYRNQFKLVDREFYQQTEIMIDNFLRENKKRRQADVAE
jgi:hypothetical protein